MCPFQNGSSTSGILNKSTESGKLTCDDLCGESESSMNIFGLCAWLVVDNFFFFICNNVTEIQKIQKHTKRENEQKK